MLSTVDFVHRNLVKEECDTDFLLSLGSLQPKGPFKGRNQRPRACHTFLEAKDMNLKTSTLV